LQLVRVPQQICLLSLYGLHTLVQLLPLRFGSLQVRLASLKQILRLFCCIAMRAHLLLL
jgi:hypothetical protein